MSHADSGTGSLPVIDLSKAPQEAANEILEAASTHGFLFIRNNGVIPSGDIDAMFKLVRWLRDDMITDS